MQKWEYMEIHRESKVGGRLSHINDDYIFKKKIEFLSYLNKLGDDGWEVVNYAQVAPPLQKYLLKRPKE